MRKEQIAGYTKGMVTGMNCCRCGKSFDYEKHNGICPKCAAYNRPQGQAPYDYDVDKDISAHYEGMDESHARLHRMYDSAPAHQPDKQHAAYHRQYDDHYSHSNRSTTQRQNGAQKAGTNQPNPAQGQNGMPAYRVNQPNPAQGQNGMPAYRVNQPNPAQGQNGMPAYRVNQPNPAQGQNGMPNQGVYQMQGPNGNPPQGKQTKSIAAKVIWTIIIINIISAFVKVFFI